MFQPLAELQQISSQLPLGQLLGAHGSYYTRVGASGWQRPAFLRPNSRPNIGTGRQPSCTSNAKRSSNDGEALEAMQSMSQSSGDALSEQSANVLRRLSVIQMTNNFYTAEGNVYISVQARSADTASGNTTEEGEPMFIPYFGVLHIVPPKGNCAVQHEPVTITIEAGTVTRPGYIATHSGVELIDPLLLDLRDGHWVSQTIDMTFLDAFLDGTM